jgi:hypothetical protein
MQPTGETELHALGLYQQELLKYSLSYGGLEQVLVAAVAVD